MGQGYGVIPGWREQLCTQVQSHLLGWEPRFSAGGVGRRRFIRASLIRFLGHRAGHAGGSTGHRAWRVWEGSGKGSNRGCPGGLPGRRVLGRPLPKLRSERIRPPALSVASRTRRCGPAGWSLSLCAALSPARPLPTTTTRGPQPGVSAAAPLADIAPPRPVPNFVPEFPPRPERNSGPGSAGAEPEVESAARAGVERGGKDRESGDADPGPSEPRLRGGLAAQPRWVAPARPVDLGGIVDSRVHFPRPLPPDPGGGRATCKAPKPPKGGSGRAVGSSAYSRICMG